LHHLLAEFLRNSEYFGAVRQLGNKMLHAFRTLDAIAGVPSPAYPDMPPPASFPYEYWDVLKSKIDGDSEGIHIRLPAISINQLY
jgi:hypothetical protein